MNFLFENQTNILEVKNDFAVLGSITKNQDLNFDIFFDFNQILAIKRNSLKVKIQVSNESETDDFDEDLSKDQFNSDDNSTLIQGKLSAYLDSQSKVKNSSKKIILTKICDLTAFINNQVVGDVLKNRKITNNKHELVPTSIKQIKKFGVELPSLAYYSHNLLPSASISNQNLQVYFKKILTQYKQDPSILSSATKRSSSELQSLNGTLTPTTFLEFGQTDARTIAHNNIIGAIANPGNSLFSFDNDSYMNVYSQTNNESLSIKTSITINNAYLNTGNNAQSFFVKFFLLDDKGHVLQMITKSLNVSQLVDDYKTPKNPPSIEITKTDLESNALLKVSSVDDHTTHIDVYKKTISNFSMATGYRFFKTLKVNDVIDSIQVPISKNTIDVYRFITRNDSLVCHDYSNVIVTYSHALTNKRIKLSYKQDVIGNRLLLLDVPSDVICVEFLCKNVTLCERIYKKIDNNVYYVDPSSQNIRTIEAVHTNVKDDNIYEYAVKYTYKSGTSSVIPADFQVERIKQEPNKVSTTVSDLSIIDNQDFPTVNFKISTIISNSDADDRSNVLQKQGSYTLYESENKSERINIKNLIAHYVTRCNLSTGEYEDFGVVTSKDSNTEYAEVNDSYNQETQKNLYLTKPLVRGQTYRYYITPLIRDKESSFETNNLFIELTTIDKKTYKFDPSKFWHPFALKKGVITTTNNLKIGRYIQRLNYLKKDLEYGAVGDTKYIDVSFEQEATVISNVVVKQLDQRTNLITWKATNVGSIDHFLIIKECLGIRTIIGKSHSNFVDGNCVYRHKLKNDDVGHYRYIIKPILNDYLQLQESATNYILVDKFIT